MSAPASSLVASTPALGRRLVAILICLAAAGLMLMALGWVIGGNLAPAPPRPTPFGIGIREAAPVTTGLAGWLLQQQAQFFRALTQGVRAAMENPSALVGLVGLSFAYGVFHAAGPGHGKAVISAYIIADRSSLKRAFGLSLAVAMVQALGAVLIVLVLTLLIRATVFTQTKVTAQIDLAAFAVLTILGLWLLWRKSAQIAAITAGQSAALSCDHVHLPGPNEAARMGFRETALMVLAAGARPCMGTIVVLTFALSAGAFAIGLGAALAIGLGVALTTSALAMLAALFKDAALKLAGGRSGLIGATGLAWLEGIAAAFIVLIGLTLAFGLGTASLPR